MASSGIVTPDAAWSAVGDQSKGAWTPDVDWQNIPDNSRHYPMHDGTPGSGVLQDIIGGHDATIQNYDADSWQYSNTNTVTVAVSGSSVGWSSGNYGDFASTLIEGYEELVTRITFDTVSNLGQIEWNIAGIYPEITGLLIRWDDQSVLFARTAPLSNIFEAVIAPAVEASWIALEGVTRSISISISKA